MVLVDGVNRTVVDEQFQKYLQVQLIDCFLIVFNILTVPDLVLHVLDLLLSWVETHAPHHVGYCTQRHLPIELSCLSGMLILGSNLTVVEEVLQITHHLPVGPSLEQLGERVIGWLLIEALAEDREVNFPHVDTQVNSSRSEE